MGPRRDSSATARIDDAILSQLQQYVAAREIERGLACLRLHQDVISAIDVRQPNAARLLVLLAIWSDIGFHSSPSVKELLPRFSARSGLTISDYLCLRMAEGMVAMADEAMELAIPHFDFVLGLPDELDNPFLLSIALLLEGPLPASAGRVRRRPGSHREGKSHGARARSSTHGGRDAGTRRLAFVSARQMERCGARLGGGGKRAAPDR